MNSINVLNMQLGGTSQSAMKSLLNTILNQHGINIYNAGSNNGVYLYLDDVCYSGNRIKNDINTWLSQAQGLNVNKIIILTIAYHANGQWYANGKINEKIRELGRQVSIEWWTCCIFENRKRYLNDSDIFSPKTLPDDRYVNEYCEYLSQQGFPPQNNLRNIAQNQQPPKVFSDENSRDLLEQEFLKKGSYIRHICGNLPEAIRPLGFSLMKTLGFGSTIITYRNCSNTAPTVLWVGDPWYPLFPRRVN